MFHQVWLILCTIKVAYGSIPSKAATINGDFIIGGLFSVHKPPTGTEGALVCGTIRELYGIQRVEAALYTLDQINNNSDLLRGIFSTFICKIIVYYIQFSRTSVKWVVNGLVCFGRVL